MNRFKLSEPLSRIFAIAAVLALCPALPAQNTSTTAKQAAPSINSTNTYEMEPMALNALRAMSDRLRAATDFSFTARIMREEPGTNGQMLDFFKTIRVQVQRPNKMRLQARSDTSDVSLWYDGRNVTLMPASGKMFTTLAASPTLDATLTMLKTKADTHTPLLPFLSSNPYSILADGLQSANQIGTDNDGNGGNDQLLHLAFTEPAADWQLWLTGPNRILPRRMAIVYKKIEGQPRVTIEFSNWNLNAETPSGAFVFLKPEGAASVSWDALRPRKFQAER